MKDMGSEIVNTDYIDGLIAKVEAATSTAELEAYAADLLQPISGQLAGIQAQIEYLAPFLALLSPPTLPEIITWVTKLITAQIAPQVEAYTKCVAQAAIIAQKLAQAEQAVEKAKARIAAMQNKADALKSKAQKATSAIGV
jgi:hypothetical protein